MHARRMFLLMWIKTINISLKKFSETNFFITDYVNDARSEKI